MKTISTAKLVAALPRERLGLMAGGIIACALLIMVSLLHSPFSRWQQVRQASDAMSQQVGNQTAIEQSVIQLRGEIEQKSSHLFRTTYEQNDVSMHLMRHMNELAERHGLRLGNISPIPAHMFMNMEETPLSAELRGSYHAVARWIQDLERSDPFVSLTQLNWQVDAQSGQIVLRASISAFRPVGAP